MKFIEAHMKNLYTLFVVLFSLFSTTNIVAQVSFSPKIDFTTGPNPVGVAIGDVDGDGKPDLVVTNEGSNTVSVYRNTSTSGSMTAGSFALKVDFTTGAQPYGVAIGDVDGDGKPELVLGNYAGNTLSVYRNTGTSGSITAGSFAAKVDFTTGAQPNGAAMGDMDGDGKLDIVLANVNGNTFSVYRNTSTNGSITAGSFAPKVDFTTGQSPMGVAIGDVDGDGRPDVVVPNQSGNTVSVYRNTSTSGSITTGSFAAQVDFTTGTGPYAAAVGDVDGDGKSDIVVINQGSNTVSVYRNTSTSGSITAGSFAAKVDFATGATPVSVVIGDLDGDGKRDLAVANNASAAVSVFRNTSTIGSITPGSFDAKIDFTVGTGPWVVRIGDVDGDGGPDLAVTNYGSNTVSVLRNTRLGSICGVKFNDSDGDGMQDPGELGLPNWIINLSYNQATGPVTLIDTTDANGNYCFNGLQGGGIYTVSETNQTGWQQTFPATPGTHTVTLAAGQTIDRLNFGNKRDAGGACITWDLLGSTSVTSISGSINGQPEIIGAGTTPPPMSIFGYSNGQQLWVGTNGWVAGLLDLTRYIEFNASPQSGNAFTVSNVSFDYGDFPLTTDFNMLNFKAYYSIDGWANSMVLNATALVYLNTAMSTFTMPVSVVVPSGQTFSLRIYPYALQNGMAGVRTFAVHKNVVICGTTAPEVVRTGSICGVKFNDVNGNGVKDAGEPGLPNWKINLSYNQATGQVTLIDTTDVNGNYCFNSLTAGTYIVSETNQSGWGQTFPAAPGTHTVTLAAGQTIDGLNFGNKLDLCINGTKAWSPLGTGVTNGTNGEVWALAVIGSDLYVGGNFTTAGGNTVNHIAKWNGSSWSALISSGNGANGINGIVTALAVIGTDLYAGGWFTTAGGIPAENIAKWDGTNWSPLGNGLPAAGAINALAAMGNNLYATSYILEPALGGPGNLIVKWDGANWSSFSVMNDYVSSFYVDGTNLYAGGQFTMAGTVPANRIAKWDGTSWSPLGSGMNYFVGGTGLTMLGGNLYAGGRFTTAGGTTANFVAQWDGSIWSPFTNGVDNGMNNAVDGLVVIGTDLYASGSFTTAEGVSANSIAQWDGANWSPLGSGMNDGVWRLAAIGNDLYAGGIFTTAGGGSANYIAKWECKPGTSLGSICGVKFNDLNGNGLKDAGELGLPNWIINLSYNQATGPVTLIDTTDAKGNYCFNALPGGGIYTVSETNQTGWQQTGPASPGTYTVTLAAGQNIDSLNFGNRRLLECVAPPDSMMGWWTGDGTANDISGNNNHGTLQGGAVYGSGKVANAFTVMNAADYVTVPDHSSLNFGTLNFSIDAWVRTTDSTSVLNIVDKRTGTESNPVGYSLFISSGKLAFQMGDGSPTLNRAATTSPISDGKWHLVAVTVERQNTTGGKLYVDGNLIFTFDPTTRSGSITNTAPLYIGQRHISSATQFRGQIDEVELFNSVLSAGEIFSIFAADSAGKCKSSEQLGSICGVKFNDLNGDGVMDRGEPGLPNWRIGLNIATTPPVLTDSLGRYCFNNLPAGTYTVAESSITGWQQTFPSSPGTHTVTLTAGQNINDINFGNKVDTTGQNETCITWALLDTNLVTSVVGNIVGQPEILGVGSPLLSTGQPANPMSIYGYSNGQQLWVGQTGGTWVPDPPSTPMLDPLRYIQFDVSPTTGNTFTVTSVSFQYGDLPWNTNFNILAFQAFYSKDNWSTSAVLNSTPLVYLNTAMSTFNVTGLNVPVASGSTFSLRIYPYPILHGMTALPSFATHNTVLICGTTAPEVSSTGSLCGVKFNDLNGNGVRDAGEPGLPSWQIGLNVATVPPVLTDSLGRYCFNNLPPGTYVITETQQTGWTQTAPPSPGTHTVTLALGQNIGNLDFGNKLDPCINGTKTWLPLGSGINGGVFAIAVSGTDLYVGGQFTTAGGGSANNIAKWNGTSWLSLGGGINGTVMAITVSGTDLYAGGTFTTAGGVSANNIAKWDGSTWSSLGGGINGTVWAITVSGTDLYAGGAFTTAGGVSVNNIAKWNGTTWSALGSGINATVAAITVSGTDLYAGGAFTTAGGVSANNIAKWNGTTWSALGSGINGTVYATAVIGTELFAGGSFTTAGGASASYVAKWNGANWSALGTGMNSSVRGLAGMGTDLYAGGSFTTAGGVPTNRIATWNGTTWSALGTGMNASAYALAVSGTDLYAGGGFTTAGGVNVNYIAKYSCGVPTSVSEDRTDNVLPQRFELKQNYPNPFNPTTQIAYELPSEEFVSLRVYNSLGQEVAVLVDGQRSAGAYAVTFQAADLPSGMYFYRLIAGEFRQTRKLLLLR